MDGDVLAKRGFTLAEACLVLLIAGVLIAAVFYSAGKMRQAGLAQRTINELNAIADAGTRYYQEKGAWPQGLADLRPEYLSAASSDFNPFGSSYTITAGVSSVSVSTLLPKGLVTSRSFGTQVVVVEQAENDLVSVTKTPESGNWRLKYEKKHIHGQ